MNLQFLDINSDILRKKNEKIELFDDLLEYNISELHDLMVEADGVGIAAPQAGWNVTAFIWRWEGWHIAINPRIKPIGYDQHVCIEGCLSLPGKSYTVARYRHIKMQAQDLVGDPYEQMFSGYETQIIQHEFDHLCGKLICDEGVKNPL